MNKNKLSILVIVSLALIIISSPMAVQAGLRYTEENHIFTRSPGQCTFLLTATIDASPVSGYNVHVDSYDFTGYFYAYTFVGYDPLPPTGAEIYTIDLTFSGDGIGTHTYHLMSDGNFHIGNVPSWMTTNVLVNDPKGLEWTASIPVDQSFSMDAGATMTIHVEGAAVWWGIIKSPWEYTYHVSCSAYFDDTGF